MDVRVDAMNKTYSGQERRTGEHHLALTDDQIDAIAKKAAEHAVTQLTDHVYRQVGKGVVNKILWLVGACAVGVYLAGRSRGWWS